ncbi:BLOC-1-related complex subunit 8 homolog isoform X1 [Daphnia magna]|uniref:Uncharacterized protein n=2 Tax=Daphnia magna TaxID=35525 RepID=A0ABQ9ZVM2_9CRUS|nr:BLOC-1-related complex subunit 8 homolog isoform X1 [Daphnia magna]KAK4016968.1 hypothetical protein OUZ56_031928 [Daphnia magna]KZS09901.1 Protein MEF2BNB [Daphnia magna]
MASAAGSHKETDLDIKARRAMERVSENMHVVANEPSLALYRLQEHVRKALPFMVEKRIEFGQLHEQLQGRCYDADYAVSAVNEITKAKDPFEACAASLKNAIFYRQQLRYRDSRKQKKSQSMYKRFSASEPSTDSELPPPGPTRPQSSIYQS